MKPRVLVTGAPGWLGTSLVDALTNGFRSGPVEQKPEPVRILCLPGVDANALKASGKVDVATADLSDRRLPDGLCDGVDTVFHCAGVIHAKRIKDLYAINVDGTRNLLEAAIRAKVRRFVFVSSNSPAGLNAFPTRLMVEDDPPRPYLSYGLSKLQSEWLVNDAHRAGRIESVILRPCWFYGPDQPPRQTRFFTMIKEGKAPIVGGGESRRSMSYVDNTCQAIVLAERTTAARGRTYWVADRRPYTMNEIVDTVERLLEREFGIPVAHKRLRLPGIASEVALVADQVLQGLGLYKQEVHVLSEMNKTIACSIARAERELGYDPKVALEEGMRRSIRWCREHGQQI